MAKDPICGMTVNEKTGLKLVHDGQVLYFCSNHCLEKFAKGRGVSNEVIQAACAVTPRAPIYKNKTVIVALVLIGLILLSYIVPILEPFRISLISYFKTIWWAILLGLFIGGLIDYYVPHEHISYLLAKPAKQSIFYSVIIGFFMSACSHGILALAIQLHKKGASNPAVISFLLASPWANMPLTIMLISFFGLKALFLIISAIVIAIITGFIFQFLQTKGLIETNENSLLVEENFSLRQDIKTRFNNYKFSLSTLKTDIKGVFAGMVSLGNMVLWWILIGMTLASLAGAYIPTQFFSNYLGPTLVGLLVTLLLATAIEVCSEGSAPMAFEIFRQTGAFGNAFVFLMAGVVTDYTEIGLLWHNVGRKTAIWLPIVTVPQVVLLGWIANKIF